MNLAKNTKKHSTRAPAYLSEFKNVARRCFCLCHNTLDLMMRAAFNISQPQRLSGCVTSSKNVFLHEWVDKRRKNAPVVEHYGYCSSFFLFRSARFFLFFMEILYFTGRPIILLKFTQSKITFMEGSRTCHLKPHL